MTNDLLHSSKMSMLLWGVRYLHAALRHVIAALVSRTE
jgi:hypothetical protein